MPIVLVRGLKRNLFSTTAAAHQGVKIIIEKRARPLTLEPLVFS